MQQLHELWVNFFQSARDEGWWTRKKELCKKRGAKIVRIRGSGHVYRKLRYDNKDYYSYLLYISFLIKQKNDFFMEEHVTPFQFRLKNGKVLDHKEISKQSEGDGKIQSLSPDTIREESMQRFFYDRRAAVKYAEHWWNSYNPIYRSFSVDCTNYVSQCLRAGGVPMHGAPVRNQGWWYEGDSWSLSWAVAHSLRWYLSGSNQTLEGREVETANELYPGDVICYDFQGDGRWDHNTFVVAKDANGMPLVNAHTDNSRNRYWSYEDSTAWTPNISYKFFRIG